MIHHLVGSKAKPTSKRASDAVALPPAHFTDHGSKAAGEFHFRADAIHVALDAFQIERNPIVRVAFVQPQDVWVAVVWRDVSVAVAGIDIQLAVAVDVA